MAIFYKGDAPPYLTPPKLLIKLTASLLLLLLLSSTYAQNIRISGKIVATESSDGIPGATVKVKGSQVGAIAGAAGEYTIEAPSAGTLVFSSIGYQGREVKIGGRAKINVELEESASTLNEVVVVGYGEMKKTDLSSSQVSVSAADIKKTVNTTIDQALQGRAANVYVTNNSGKPGGGVSVNVRGISTISGNTEPMYVIDGVQIVPNTTGFASNVLSNLNPDDVESLQVLQGPSAQSIYGSKAANGVIVIQTKKGKAGETKLNYTSMYNYQMRPTALPTMNLREYASYSNAWAKFLGWVPTAEFADPSILGEGTNWQKEMFKPAPMAKQQLSLSGGTDRTTFYISAEHMTQEGVAINSGFKRSSVRLNLENKVRNWLKIGMNISGSGTSEKLSVGDDDLINIALQQSPNVAVRNADGSFDGPSQTQFRLSNPVALASVNTNESKRLLGLGTIYADINFLKHFSFHAELNGSVESGSKNMFNPSYKFGGFVNATTSASKSRSGSYYWNLNQRLNYNQKFKAHDVGVMLGHEAQEFGYEGLSGGRIGFISNNIQELPSGDAKSATNDSYKGNGAQESYFGRVNYMYQDKYILQATLRADGASVFGPERRWGYFPSASVAYRISKENFMKELTFIDDLKIRAEYGLTGNQNAGGIAIFSALNASPTPWGQGFLTGNFSNPNFQWESTKTYNLGFDFHAFKNRLEVIFDAYLRNTDNLILPLPLPGYLGTSGNGSIAPPVVNIGGMQNKGFGVTLNTVNMNGIFTWKSGLMFSLDRNKLTKLYVETSILDRSPWFMNSFIARSVIGQPVWQYYGYQYAGLFQNYDELKNSAIPENNRIDAQQGTWVGDYKFVDVNGDKVINEKDRTFIGSPWPTFSFGLSNTFSYKNFDLSIFMQGNYGNKIFNYTKYANSNFNNLGRGGLKSLANFAMPSSNSAADNPKLNNPDATAPRVAPTDPNGNNRPTDMYIEDGSYLRIKNIQLSYTVPKAYLSKLPIKGVRVTAGLQNAFTLTKYTGYDPEIGASNDKYGGNRMIGVDYGRYPSVRMATFSLSADF
jgi:TonB-linked SusC/RagA family outer membrane protein